MTDQQRMLREYVIPFIIMQVLVLCFMMLFVKGMDKEAQFDKQVVQSYK